MRELVVFRAGRGQDGRPRIETTVCPSRLLREAPEADTVLRWWLESSPWDGNLGAPCGPPEWPLPGGMLRQPAKLVHAAQLLRAEFPYLERRRGGETSQSSHEAAKAARQARKRKH